MKNAAWEELAKAKFREPNRRHQLHAKGGRLSRFSVRGGRDAYAVQEANAPLAIYADPPARFIYDVPRLYFAVPAACRQFIFRLSGGSGVETAKLTVYDAEGAQAGAVELTLQKNEAELAVSVPQQQGDSIWALSVDKAAEGVLETRAWASKRACCPCCAISKMKSFKSKWRIKMRAVFLWLAVLSLGGHRGWAQASAPPLLQNGSFENIQGVRLDAAGLYNGWQIVGEPRVPVAWALNSHYTGRLEIRSDGAYEGQIYVRLRGGERSGHIYQMLEGVEAGRWHRISLWARGEGGGVSAYHISKAAQWAALKLEIFPPVQNGANSSATGKRPPKI